MINLHGYDDTVLSFSMYVWGANSFDARA